jgi:HD-GYP domain-containing protein (c-di-GMP phosphodiesterase class II)
MDRAGRPTWWVADHTTPAEPFSVETVRAWIGQALEDGRLRVENGDDPNPAKEQLATQEGWLEDLFVAGVQSPSSPPELRDPYTPGHSVRVSAYAGAIARALGLDDETIRQIELGGYVHDLGKIGVREDVLNKPGPLTRTEYEHIMIHPVVGWQILAPLLAGAPIVLNIVRSHHERMDGQGVPDQLHGQAIPLEARIATVADALDAMTSARPYRRGELTLDGAMDELQRHGGDQFDRDIVEATLQAAATGELALAPRTTPVS